MSNVITSIQFKRGNKIALELVLVGDKKPLKGEPIWEIDTNKLKIGNGIDDYVNLPYLNGGESEESPIVSKGYYYNGRFYEDEEHTIPLVIHLNRLYFDIPTLEIYYYSPETSYTKLVSKAQVDSNLPGLVKLYSSKGNNTDGTMTQNAITLELNKKVEMSLEDIEDECVIFGYNLSE